MCILVLPPGRACAAGTLGTSEDLLRGCDIYGNTNTETSFGSVAADAAAEYAGAGIALLPSEDFGTNVQPGDVTWEVLAACLQNDSELAAADLSAARIWEMLEISFSRLTLAENGMIDREGSYFAGYLQTSGLRVRCDAAAPAGERVRSVALADGTPLEREDEASTYRVVSARRLLLGEYGYPALSEQELEYAGTEREAAAAYFQARGCVRAPEGGRVQISGTRDWLRDNWMKVLLLAAALFLILAQLSKSRQREDAWRASRTATAKDVEEQAAREAAGLTETEDPDRKGGRS